MEEKVKKEEKVEEDEKREDERLEETRIFSRQLSALISPSFHEGRFYWGFLC